MNLTDPDERKAVSAEYVIGLLDDSDRRTVELAMRQDRELAAEIGYWQDHLLGLLSGVTPVTPSPRVWSQVAAALPTNPMPRPAPKRNKPTWWDRFGLVHAFAAMATCACIALGSMLYWQNEASVNVYVAVLKSTSDQQEPAWMVKASTAGTLQIVPLARNREIPVGQVLELWTQPDGAVKPISLGLIASDQPVSVAFEKLPSLTGNQLFAISLEPAGGSPTGDPTKVLFAGHVELIR